MIFRLDDNTLIDLDDSLIGLSEYFRMKHQDVQAARTVADYIHNSPYKKFKAYFIKALEDCIQGTVSAQDIESLKDVNSKLSQDMLNIFQDQFAANDADLRETLQYVRDNLETIFKPAIYNMPFLKSETMKLVIEFLQIPCTKRSTTMFDGLPFLIQGCPPDEDIKSLLESPLHVYIDFINRASDIQLLDMAKASCLLKIHSLSVLVGCRLARFISELDEKTLRQRFAIPDKFKTSVLEKLGELTKDQPWMTSTK
jgi:hypothetical protein